MSLYNILDVSASGLSAQRKRAEILSQNIANSETTRTADGGPYRRQRVIFEAEPARASFRETLVRIAGQSVETHPRGVRVTEVATDNTPGERRYLPDHPDADPGGYVEFPSFNPVEDMVDLISATRSYQANLQVVSAVKEMINRTIDIAR